MSTHRYMLRTCAADMTSRNDFRWPESGHVECPDWNPEPVCGGGLHGLLDGHGGADLLSWRDDARWLVVRIDEWVAVPAVEDDEHPDKVKAPRGEVVYCGDRAGAAEYGVRECGWDAALAVGSTLTGGDDSTLTGGYGSTLTGGYGSTLTGGYGSTLTGGDRSTLTGGDDSTLTGGYGSTLTGGDRSTLTGGYGSTLTAKWWDGRRYRIATFYVGEDGIEAGVAYRVDDKGQSVRIDRGEQ